MGFLKKVGRESGANIDPKRYRKSDGKMEGTEMATRHSRSAGTMTLPTSFCKNQEVGMLTSHFGTAEVLADFDGTEYGEEYLRRGLSTSATKRTRRMGLCS